MRRILALSIIQDFFIPIGLTLFIHAPGAQIATCLIFMIICLFTVISHTAFKKIEQNFLEAGNRVIYILILIVFLINLVVDKKISEKHRFNYIGFGIIGLISLLIGINITISFWVIVNRVKELFKKKGENDKNSKSEVLPWGKEGIRKPVLEESIGLGSKSTNQGSSGFKFINSKKKDDEWKFPLNENQPKNSKSFGKGKFGGFKNNNSELARLKKFKKSRFERKAADSPFVSEANKHFNKISSNRQKKSKLSVFKRNNPLRVKSNRTKFKLNDNDHKMENKPLDAQSQLDEFAFE